MFMLNNNTVAKGNVYKPFIYIFGQKITYFVAGALFHWA